MSVCTASESTPSYQISEKFIIPSMIYGRISLFRRFESAKTLFVDILGVRIWKLEKCDMLVCTASKVTKICKISEKFIITSMSYDRISIFLELANSTFAYLKGRNM